jgi:hypothetical protein
MTTRRREQPLNTEPPQASRIAAKVADEIQSATLGMDKSPTSQPATSRDNDGWRASAPRNGSSRAYPPGLVPPGPQRRVERIVLGASVAGLRFSGLGVRSLH